MNFRLPLISTIAIQLILFAISLIKSRKFPSLHTYAAKIWGLTILITTVRLLGLSYANTL